MDTIVLDTPRLALRAIGMEDAAELQVLFSDPEVMRFMEGTRDLTTTRAWIARHTAFYRTRGCGVWGVELRGVPGLLGYCGLVPQDVAGREELEIGYLLGRRHWHQGYATEAAVACRDFAFRRYEVPRVVSLIAPANAASIAVARRVRMTFRRQIEKWDRAIAVYALDRPTAGAEPPAPAES
jgi:RimJ/RimL family protein N-acetyltransferase